MNFEEHAAKPLLAKYGIAVPESRLASNPQEAEAAAATIGPCVVKAQVPTGKRGKAGGIKLAATPQEARQHAENILGMDISGWTVGKVLIEAQTPIARELYVAILDDRGTKGPMLLFSGLGGMDVEEAAESDPNAMRRIAIPIDQGLSEDAARSAIEGIDDIAKHATALVDVFMNLYRAWRELDAELIEINPLVITKDGRVVALDCKFTLDDSSAARQKDIAANAAPEKQTVLEAKAADAGLKYIELDGSVGVLANGAGLTMTTMDVIAHYGGSASNFLEIGGEAYTKAKTALSILLENPNIKALLVNFCGAFARTDVMAEGVINAWQDLKPDIPIFFTIHGTGAEDAVALVRDRLGIEPYDLMDDAVKAAVAAATGRAAA
ncbi:MAG: acetate--CoA ligase family protein [Hyphomicrobiaceae bacterium]|nr:acetate--CoA ligase family protein [Hyphomicrobiaceae bacterium]MCC0008915.1 acetate--CoA ligase family protein [Hyphomicrobiaceae bacterium]